MRKLNKKIWPYSVTLTPTEWELGSDKRELWLYENINKDNFYIVGVTKPTFYFKREKDMTWFLLNCG